MAYKDPQTGEYKEISVVGGKTSIIQTVSTYQASTSGTIIPTGEWLDNVPAVPQAHYLWSRIELRWNTGQTTMLYTCARQGLDGSGSVSSVNDVSPDSSGNVALPIDAVPTAGSSNPVTSGSLETIISGMKSDVSAFYSDGTTVQTVSDLATAIKAKPDGSRIVYRLSPNVVKALAQSDTTLYGTAIVYKASENNAYFLAFNRDTAGYGNISLESDTVTLSHHIVENVFERNTVYSQNIYSCVPGVITNGQYHIDLTLTVPKSLQYISSITVTRLVGGLRHSGGGYVGSGRIASPWSSADGVDLVGKSELTIIATKVSNCSIRITLANTKQFTDGTTTTLIPNNSIVNFYGQLDLMLQ